MRIGLYKKIFFWLSLNLVLLVLLIAVLAGGLLFKGSNGLLPAYLFSNNIESVFRIISAQCQYKPMTQWGAVLNQHRQGNGLFYTMLPLEPGFHPQGLPPLPPQVQEAAANMPRQPFTLCPDPTIVLPSYESFADEADVLHIRPAPQPEKQPAKLLLAAGIQPTPSVLFMRAGEPARYWLARALFIPDETQVLRYVLLTASSDSISGHGLFFDVHLILGILGGGLLVSCLWWWPFVRHISRPLQKMSAVAEQLTTDVTGTFLDSSPGANICGVDARRQDEIGRLGQSINIMAQHLHDTFSRQKLFISHIAQELNLPLARVKQALTGMEEVAESQSAERLNKVIAEVEHLAVLTDDILNFLREESGSRVPAFEKLELQRLIQRVITIEAGDNHVRLHCPKNIFVHCPAIYLERALGNVLRNALKYAGKAEITVSRDAKKIRIEVLDEGPGVPEADLPLLGKPFFRSSAKTATTGAGLGLSIVKYCSDACKGSVVFKNRQPHGFKVSITLPST